MISFDGTANTVVDLRTSLQCVQGNNPRSISFMIQTTYTSGCSAVLSTGSALSSQAFGIGFSCNGTANIIQVYSNNADYLPTTGKVINDGLWHSISVIYDGTTLSIYVDGSLDNSATSWNSGSSATVASTLNTVGNSINYLGQWMNTNRWKGQLKNVIFYDYVIIFVPSSAPSMIPSVVPTAIPTIIPSKTPTLIPSNKPSVFPTMIPSCLPSLSPSIYPTIIPSVLPSVFPSSAPAILYSSGKHAYLFIIGFCVTKIKEGLLNLNSFDILHYFQVICTI